MKIILTILSFALASSFTISAAPGEGDGEKGPCHHPLPPEVVKGFDKDGDGELSKVMLEAMKNQRDPRGEQCRNQAKGKVRAKEKSKN